MIDPNKCTLCGAPATWQAFIVLRDLPPVRVGNRVARPKDVRVPSPIHGACDECQPKADGVTAAAMLERSWPEIAAAIVAVGLPAPDRHKATVQWERPAGGERDR